MNIRIVSDNDHYNSLLRQVPANGYPGFSFTLNPDPCDVLVVLEYPKTTITGQCTPDNIWLWSMEPPEEEWEWIRKCYKYFSRIITIDTELRHPKIIHNQLAIPWQIDKNYEELIADNFFDKKIENLSFITSNYTARKGHRRRLQFLKNIQGKLDFDLWGRGFRNMDDKSVALIPYRYTILVENSNHKDYWSEKLADAFLCGCLPFYFGCPNLHEYFDEKAFIRIDINKPGEAVSIIKKAVENNEWEKRKMAIEEARKKILLEYQFFPVLISLIKKYSHPGSERKLINIPFLSHHPSHIKPLSVRRNYYLLKKKLFKKRYLDLDSRYFGFTTYK